MERTNKGEKNGVIKWRKKSAGGSFRMGNGRIIKPGQKFTATLDEIPEAFRDTIIPLDIGAFQTAKTQSQEVGDVAETKYFVQHVISGWYNVVDSAGKAQNERRLRKEAADTLLGDLLK